MAKAEFFQKLQLVFHSTFFTAIIQSRGLRYSLAAILVGFSLARLLHAASLYAYSSARPAVLAPPVKTTTQSAPPEIEDPKAAIGGTLFTAPQTGSDNKSAEIVLPIKNFKLVGTLESGADVARALIEVQGEGTREYCAAGTSCTRQECACSVQNMKITAIAKEFVWLKSGTARYKLAIGQATADIIGAQPPASENTVTTDKSQVFSQTISREDIVRIIEGKDGSLLKGRFGPRLVNGNIDAYEIIQIPPDHIFAKLGGRNGDVIKKVNGYPLTGLERVLDLLKALPTMPAIKVEIERGGKNVTYDFQIRK